MYELRTLGGLDLVRRSGDRAEVVTLAPKPAYLLAYLVVERRGRPHRRSRLIELLWPQLEARRGRAALSQALYLLRRELGQELIRNRGREEILLDAPRVWCDAAVVEACLGAGRIGVARDLWTGDFLAGLEAGAGPALERWIDEVRGRMRTGFDGAAHRHPQGPRSARTDDSARDGRLHAGEAQGRAPDPEADALYRRALSAFVHRSLTSLREARALFALVLARDASRADALAALAETEVLLAMYDPGLSSPDLLRSAMRHAVEAVQSDPLCPAAHRALGRGLEDLGQREAALRAFDRAIELDELDAEARQWRATLLFELGHPDDAREESARAVQLAPHSAAMHTGQAYLHYLMGEHRAALSAARRALMFAPDHEGARTIEALALFETGDPQGAENAVQNLVRDLPEHVYGRAVLAWIRARMGRSAPIDRPASPPAQNLRHPSVLPLAIARLAEGDIEDVLHVLATHRWNAVDRSFLAFAPVFDELRSDPRFAGLLADAGLSSVARA